MTMLNTSESPALLTTKELAEYLRVPRTTIYAWRNKKAKTPTAHFVGRHLRWSKASIDSWLENGGSKGAPDA